MKFNEKFIDREIGELCMEYDKIKGANTNIQRISPSLIDGLKPVQRRALFVMFDKDGGRMFHKLATISGDVFGKVHPHCLHGDTEFLLTDGTRKSIKELYESDQKVFKIFSYCEDGTTVTSVMHDVRITKYVSDLTEVTFSNGGSLKCTHDHRLLVVRDNKATMVEAQKLEVGDVMYPESNHITVESIHGVLFYSEIPVYDFTADPCHNGMVHCGNDGFIFVSNSPVAIEDAIVNIAQTWHNNIPLIEGQGNFGCHDASTEVLTATGWKLFHDLKDSDLLATVPFYEPDQPPIYEKPTARMSYPYAGSMITNDDPAYAFKVTPNHNLLISEDGVTFHFETAINVMPMEEVWMVFQSCQIVKIHPRETFRQHYYHGRVYCAEVPTYHTLITRYNGVVLTSGNSISGDPAGASRYIKARLSEYAYACFFEDWKDSVVDTTLAYDEETRMPDYLPAKYPNVLLNGCLGIGFGMSSNVPTYNFREVVESCIRLMRDPRAKIILIPDSPTGADIIQTDFASLCERGYGSYMQRATYEIDASTNTITITSVPDQVTVNSIREKIADLKEKNGLAELITMNDLSGKSVDLQLVIRDDVNPYKFIRKLVKVIPGLERSYPVNITVNNDMETIDYSVKKLLLEWINWRRDQKRVVVSNKQIRLIAEYRTNEVKIFVLQPKNLDETVKIFRNSHNRKEIEEKLIERYHHTEIKMDSLQARALSDMRMLELSIDSYNACLKKREELEAQLKEIEEILDEKGGIDKLIIAELQDGLKRFGKPRNSNVVPYKIDVSSEVEGSCILQLSSEGTIKRNLAANAEQEPIPTDSNGFAVKVDNDSSFILIDHLGNHSFVRVNEIPVDTEVPVNRYMKKPLPGHIIAMLPCNFDEDKCVVLISKSGVCKRMRISEIGPSKRPVISIDKSDSLVRGIVLNTKSTKDLLVFTRHGMGQRLDPNSIKITSPNAKGGNAFKLIPDDEIVGCYAISPEENQYLLYVTLKAKMRLNNIEYLPTRDSKHDKMINLISLNERDRLLAVVGCNKFDKLQVFYGDGTKETIAISSLKEGTMATRPTKVVKKAIENNTMNVVKVKLV